MEQNIPTISKKIWKIVRVLYFMLRKGISKGKLLADLNMMMKRGKLAGKNAIHNLMSHHHNHGAAASSHRASFPNSFHEYEFSCSESPQFRLPFHLSKRKHSHAPPPFDSKAMVAALEMIHSVTASPALPGFGRSPVVRQLRITDSPFPLRDSEEDNHVDEAAEEFISKFYNDLKRQNSKAYLDYY